MEPRMPKWSPRGASGAQEAKMEPRRPKWNPRGPKVTQDAQIDPRRGQDAQIEPKRFMKPLRLEPPPATEPHRIPHDLEPRSWGSLGCD